MNECPNLLNTKMVELIKNLGKENCFIITNGGADFQKDKITHSGISHLFNEINIVPGGKKEKVESICEKFKNEKVIFVDDKPIFFEDLNYKKYPYLKTILYNNQDLRDILISKN